MINQANFEEVHPLYWLNDTSQFTEKYINTYSEVSAEHFIEELLMTPQEEKHSSKNIICKKQKNKVNAKNFRDRRKIQLESMRKELQYLQIQNDSLKNQKYCKWCRKPYADNAICTETKINQKISMNETSKNKQMEIEFYKPELYVAKKGKIWIALGILMMVLGISLYGVMGDNNFIKEIQIGKEEAKKWTEAFKNEKSSEEYIQVNMRFKQQRKQIIKVQPSQLKILYRPTEFQSAQNKESVSISKEFLYGIQASLDNIGQYI